MKENLTVLAWGLPLLAGIWVLGTLLLFWPFILSLIAFVAILYLGAWLLPRLSYRRRVQRRWMELRRIRPSGLYPPGQSRN